MARKFKGGKLVIASHNLGKVREISELLTPYDASIVSARDLGLPEPVENGLTFVANAKIKAHAASMASGLPALADDSGLAVHGLNDDPGIYSARWAGPNKDFSLAMKRVQKGLRKVNDKSAYFNCALALCWPDGHSESFEGQVHGKMIWPPRGDNGFGYDATFVANGMDISFAEMQPQDKHAISHRAKAFKKLVEACFGPTK